jgi:hypothetical protein
LKTLLQIAGQAAARLPSPAHHRSGPRAKAVVIRFADFNQRIEEKWYMFI